MLVGHHGFSFAARSLDRTVPLWHPFVAVQLVDFAWALALLLGVEQARLLPRVPGTVSLDLHYMPYTHSLLAGLVWAAATLILYRRFWSAHRTRRAGVLVATVRSRNRRTRSRSSRSRPSSGSRAAPTSPGAAAHPG